MKRNILWVAGSALALCGGWLLCRFTFFNVHGMKEWPLDLAIFGLAAIVAAAFFHGRRVLVCVPSGYLAGFALAMLFQTDGVDPGGGTTNNAWKIWMFAFLAAILLGILWDLWIRRTKRRTKPS